MKKIKKYISEIYAKLNNLPEHIRIEACSLCQLNCRDCFMRTKSTNPVIGDGYLKYSDYKAFIGKHQFIKSVELSLCGEIFLNPELENIIKFSFENDINLTALNGVNFNTVSDEMLEMLVKYHFKAISFSIDGATNETYAIYRRNGNYDKVIQNIRKLNEYKEKYNSKFPFLTWQYVAFKHNLHEIDIAIEKAKELNMVFFYLKEPWNNEVTVNRQRFYITNPQYYDKDVQEILIPNNIPLCKQVFMQPQINWDGRILGCCCSTRTPSGINVFKNGLKKAMNSVKIKEMQSVITGEILPTQNVDCIYCNFYHDMKSRNSFIKR